MLDTTRVVAPLAAARAYADKVGLRIQLEERLTYLERYAAPRPTRCTLRPDFAPYSFALAMEVRGKDGEWHLMFEGGLLYHGPHDGHGSGLYPTLSVTTTPTLGWSLHT